MQTTHFEPFALAPTGEYCPDCGAEIMASVAVILGTEQKWRLVCDCIAAKRDAEHKALVDAGKAIIRDDMRKAAGLGRRWAGIRLGTIAPRDGQERAHATAQRFIDGYYNRDDGKGLILVGATGSGKTMIAAGIANAIIDSTGIDDYEAEIVGKSRMIQHSNRTPVRMINTVDMLSQIKAGYDSGGAQNVIDMYKGARLVILDDVGAEKLTEWSVERLFEIVNHRYEEYLPMVITTNCDAAEFEHRVGPRIKDRLYDMCYIMPITAPTQRGL